MAITYAVDLKAPARPYPHYWEFCVGSCHAATLLRKDVQDHIRKAHNEIGFKYIRFHGLFDDGLFFSALRALPGVREVTGLGFMIGILPEKPAADVLAACRERGLLCLTAKDRVRLLPALNIPMELLEKAVEILRQALA